MLKMTYMCRYIFLSLLLCVSCAAFAQEPAGNPVTDATEPVGTSDGYVPVYETSQDTAYVSGIRTETADETPAPEEEKKKGAVYQGVYISADVFDPVLTFFNGGKFQFEVSADIGLWHTLFPVVEFGMMFYNPVTENYDYSANGFFVRGGVGYNLINNTAARKYDHAVIIGARYAYSNVTYSLGKAVIHDNYWQTDDEVSSGPVNADVGWVEVVAMVRVQMIKSFFMSLGVRVQFFPHLYKESVHYPTYVPGFGQYAEGVTNWNFDLSFCYQFPYKKKGGN